MLYAINVLKKIIMKEKSYILFWKVKKNVNIETRMFAKYTLNYVFVWWNLSATTALHSSFQSFQLFYFVTHWAVYFITIQSTAIIDPDFAKLLHFAQRMSQFTICFLFSFLESFAQLP